jgi:hypothetical protein
VTVLVFSCVILVNPYFLRSIAVSITIAVNYVSWFIINYVEVADLRTEV